MSRVSFSTAFWRLALWLTIALLVAIVFVPDAFAATAGAVVDLTPFVAELREYLLTLAVVLVNIGLGYLVRYFNLSGSAHALKAEEIARTFLHETADRGLTLALSRVQPHLQAIDVRSEIAADVIEYVQRQAPDALVRLKADPASLGRLVEAKLSEVLPALDGRRSGEGFPFGTGAFAGT